MARSPIKTAEPVRQPHPLDTILKDVIEQVTKGKGQRHGGDTKPFYEQQWAALANTHGNGFLTGQAAKKITEAVESGNIEADPEAFDREIIGAMVYLGMSLLHRRGLPDPE